MWRPVPGKVYDIIDHNFEQWLESKKKTFLVQLQKSRFSLLILKIFLAKKVLLLHGARYTRYITSVTFSYTTTVWLQPPSMCCSASSPSTLWTGSSCPFTSTSGALGLPRPGSLPRRDIPLSHPFWRGLFSTAKRTRGGFSWSWP